MTSLLEAAVAVALSAGVMTTVVASLSGLVRLEIRSSELEEELFTTRQLEHLVDRATLGAGAGPSHPSPISSIAADTIVFAADLDGNGTVDTTSSETTALETRRSGTDARVRVRFGRQTMTVLDASDRDATLAAVDRRGAPAGASTASLVELTIRARDAAPEGPPPRVLAFSIPARASP